MSLDENDVTAIVNQVVDEMQKGRYASKSFNDTPFYSYWSERFKNIGLSGVVAIPNTSYDDFLWYFKNWIDKYVENYNAFLDDFNQFVTEYNDFMKQLPQQIVDTIDAAGLLTQENFGKIEDIRQPLGTKAVEKLNNEYAQRGVNIMWFKPAKDGVTDDSNAFKLAISEARDNFINGTGSNTVIIPRGVYLINQTVILPPYVKLISSGNVEIHTTYENNPVINIAYYDDDDNIAKITTYDKQGFSKGTIINGNNGGITMKYVGDKDRDTNLALAIKIGVDKDNQVQNWFARFDVSNVFITQFKTAIQFSKYNTFIIGLYNMHLERNNTNVLYGDITANSTDTASTNSGENISFYNSIFAGASNAFLINCTYYDTSFYGCSFDFNTTIFNFKRGMTTINVFGGHMENIVKVASSEMMPTTDNWYGYAPVVNLNGTTFYLGAAHEELFTTATGGILKVDLNNIRIGSSKQETKLYLVTDNVIATARNFSSRASAIWVVSKKLNPLPNNDFSSTTNYELTSSGVGETFAFTTDNIPGGLYNKAAKLTGSTNAANWGQLLTDKIPLNNKSQISLKIPIYQEGVGSYKTPTIQVTYFDKDLNEISKATNSVSGQTATTNDTWNNHHAFIDGVPINATSFTILVVVGGALENKSKWIGQIGLNTY